MCSELVSLCVANTNDISGQKMAYKTSIQAKGTGVESVCISGPNQPPFLGSLGQIIVYPIILFKNDNC